MSARVLVAFDGNTLDESPSFDELGPNGYDLATSFTISRGRQSELEKTGTGTCSIAFADSSGLLDPTNTAGPFYGKLDPMKQVALELWHPLDESFSRIFRGYKTDPEDDLQMWTGGRGLDTVTWEAADAFDLFASLELIPGVHGHTPSLANFPDVYYEGTPSNFPDEADVQVHVDDRIMKLLDDARWPNSGTPRTGLRNIFSGNVTVQGKVYDRSDQLLAALFDAADAEFPGVANIFMSREGVVTFHGRFARFFPAVPGYGINTWKVGGVAQALADQTVAVFSGPLGFRNGKSDVINSVIALPLNANDTDVAANTVEDSTSIAKYGRRSETFEDLLTSAGHNDDLSTTTAQEETLKFASYYVGNYKDAKTRISRIGFRSRAPDDELAPPVWDLLCGVELGDRIHLDTVHTAGTASGFSEYGYVEGIRYQVSGAQAGYADVTLELDVSPASFFDYNPFGTVDSAAA